MDDVLVTTEWLAEHLGDPALIVLDCTWHLPESGRKGIDDFERGHIPGARFFDLEAASDRASPYVNMLPSPADFARTVEALGVSDDSQVVIYDAGYVSARVWWMFRVFGFDRARILDGGLRRWIAQGKAAISVSPRHARPTRRLPGAWPFAQAVTQPWLWKMSAAQRVHNVVQAASIWPRRDPVRATSILMLTQFP